MQRIKLIAVDMDGVLLQDTFSPVLKRLTNKYQVDYTAEVERNTFSQNRVDAANYLKKLLELPVTTTTDQVLNIYFSEREEYLKDINPTSMIVKGVADFINRLVQLDVHLICYGGLPYEQIYEGFLPYIDYFEQYVCTNDFRPGIKEIVKDIYELENFEALFIDDVNKVAQEAKRLNVPFIGVSVKNSWGFQLEEMKKTGVKYLVNSVEEITSSYLEKIDLDKKIWEVKNNEK